MALKSFRVFITVALIAVLNGGGCNMYTDVSDKTTDEAKVDDAKILIDRGDWTGAITKLASLSAGARFKRENVVLLSSAYAGRCGLNIISLLRNLQTQTTNTFFETALAAFTGRGVADYNDCVTAEGLLTTYIGDSVARNGNENLLMVGISLGKLGTILEQTADAVDHNGTVDAGFNNCLVASVPDALADSGVTALGQLLLSLAGIGGNISGNQTTNINAVCNSLAAIDPTYNFCGITNTANVTAPMRSGFRTMMGLYTNPKVGLNIPGAPQATTPLDLCP
jgi:hypothetical protein